MTGVRLAELAATLSLATDLGRGQPMEHCVRRTAIALRIADRLGLGEDDRLATYYVGLLDNVYCHADAREQAHWFSDDIRAKALTYEADTESLQFFLMSLRLVGAGEGPLARARRYASFPGPGLKEANRWVRTHAALQSQFATAIGLPSVVSDALLCSYERWDGKGTPDGLQGEQVPIPVRIIAVADLAEAYDRRGGPAGARETVRKRSGHHIDPILAALFDADAEALLADLDEHARWEDVIDAEPGLQRLVADHELDDVLAAMADLVDMKVPHTAGHSRGVAHLAAEAARLSGMPADEIQTLQRAALVHDLGRLGVSNAVWDVPGPLSPGDLERVRLHAYLTDRMLAGIPALQAARAIAARHHERLDGSGYPRGLTAADLSSADRILAAADVYHAMSEPRPHRHALPPGTIATEMRAEVRAGRLDGEAVNAVLAAAGHRVSTRREWPAGLTAREVEVLVLLARGASNKEIARQLVVSPRTVSSHVEHIYSKLRVGSRPRATLFAIQHGLLGTYEAPQRSGV